MSELFSVRAKASDSGTNLYNAQIRKRLMSVKDHVHTRLKSYITASMLSPAARNTRVTRNGFVSVITVHSKNPNVQYDISETSP